MIKEVIGKELATILLLGSGLVGPAEYGRNKFFKR
jgi:hypothetical protein